LESGERNFLSEGSQEAAVGVVVVVAALCMLPVVENMKLEPGMVVEDCKIQLEVHTQLRGVAHIAQGVERTSQQVVVVVVGDIVCSVQGNSFRGVEVEDHTFRVEV
jgi:hypothetical protein